MIFKAFPNLEKLICAIVIDDPYLDLDDIEDDSRDYNGITLAHSSRYTLRLHEKRVEEEQKALALKFNNFPIFEVKYMVYGGVKAARVFD